MSIAAAHPAAPRLDARLPWALFGLGLALSGALLLTLQAQLSFAVDEWAFLLGRREFSLDAFLDPHNEHIAISHVAVYKALMATFGIDSARPFQVVSTAMFLLSASILFVLMRRRVGGWLALALILPILVFGPATDNLVWPFQLAFSGSMAAGLGALLALEREDRLGDGIACALLALSMSFSSLGLPFAAAVAVHLITGPPGKLRRAWVLAVPVCLYALWWLGWGSEGESFVSLKNILNAPSYALDGLAASIASLLGLAPAGGEPGAALDAGRPVLVIALGLAAYRLHRLGRVPRWVWVTGALALSFWLLAGANMNLFRLPTTARYQLMGTVFTLLVAVELLRGVRLGRGALICVFAVAAVAAASNLETLRQQWTDFRGATEDERGRVTAVEIAREHVDPSFRIPDASGFRIPGDAEAYLAAADELGSPAFTATELAAAPPKARGSADEIFARVFGPTLRPAAGREAGRSAPALILGEGLPVPGESGCSDVRPGEFGVAAVALPPGGALIRDGGAGVEVAARRYGDEFAIELGRVARGGVVALEIPTDASAEPWELRLGEFTTATVCGL